MSSVIEQISETISESRFQTLRENVTVSQMMEVIGLVRDGMRIGKIVKRTGVRREYVTPLYYGCLRVEKNRSHLSALMRDRVNFALRSWRPTPSGRIYQGETTGSYERGPDNGDLNAFCSFLDGNGTYSEPELEAAY